VNTAALISALLRHVYTNIEILLRHVMRQATKKIGLVLNWSHGAARHKKITVRVNRPLSRHFLTPAVQRLFLLEGRKRGKGPGDQISLWTTRPKCSPTHFFHFFVAIAFISPFNTQTMPIKSFYTQQHCYVSLKTFSPGGFRTRVFSFPKPNTFVVKINPALFTAEKSTPNFGPVVSFSYWQP
jgi:hypothetical protein